jgi:proteic killer suppression protein
VIKTWRDKEAAKILRREHSAKYGRFQKVARRRLQIIDKATSLDDIARVPGNRFEHLKGERKGQCSVRINRQFRVCFVWKDGDAYDVEIVDYH